MRAQPQPQRHLTFIARSVALLALLFFTPPLPAQAPGSQLDFSKATARTIPLGGNVSLIQVRAAGHIFNTGVLTGPDGVLLVDHTMERAAPLIKSALEKLTTQPVRFLIDTHWHYDHVGGNRIYGATATIIAHENVRKRLMTTQTPSWAAHPISPEPPEAWPRITFQNELSLHLNGEHVELVHFGNGHTDGDTVVFFTSAKVVQVGDLFHGRGQLSRGVDMEGLSRVLAAILARIPADEKIITGHGEVAARAELEEYLHLLDDIIAAVRQQIAQGRTLAQIKQQGLPEKWKPWPKQETPQDVQAWIAEIYLALTYPDLNR